MLPLVGVPPTIIAGMTKYQDVFCRDEGFVHVCRYVAGLILSPNKTLQGIYRQQVWEEGKSVSRVLTNDDVEVPEGRLCDQLGAEQNVHFALSKTPTSVS